MSGLYSVKPWFVRSLSSVEDRLVRRGVSADALSFAAVLVSVGAGTAIVAGYTVHAWFWLLVAPLAIARLALNALDGSVARRSGTARPFGKVINELCDRVSDAFFVAPLVIFVPAPLLVVAILVISLVSLAGLMGEVLGETRLTQGPMGKADRSLVLSLAAVAAGVTNVPVGPFVIALLVITVGGLLTIIGRVRTLHAAATEAGRVR